MFKLINIERVKTDITINNNINIKKYYFKKKIFIILGPCSLNNVKEFYSYAILIKKEIEKNINFLIRVYYEKPRTNIGWKGFVYDPYIDNSYCINDSIYIIRKLFYDLKFLNFKIAVECLNYNIIEYFLDLIDWICIGARTVNSQLHREFCSSKKKIIGIKNDCSGSIDSIKNSFLAISKKNFYLDFNKKIFLKNNGNKLCHYVLRGGNEPNFGYNYIIKCNKPIIIDCSHSNSYKIAYNQLYVFENVFNQFLYYENNITGFMFETYEYYGNQNIYDSAKCLSVTDSCINYELTKFILNKLNDI